MKPFSLLKYETFTEKNLDQGMDILRVFTQIKAELPRVLEKEVAWLIQWEWRDPHPF